MGLEIALAGRNPSLVRIPAAEPLYLRTAPLLLEPPLTRSRRRFRRHAAPFDPERAAKLLDQPLECELAVAQLTSLVLSDRAEHGSGAGDHPALLRLGQRLRGLHVEDGLHPRLRLLGMLSARPARTRKSELHLSKREDDGAGHANRLAVHGSDSA